MWVLWPDQIAHIIFGGKQTSLTFPSQIWLALEKKKFQMHLRKKPRFPKAMLKSLCDQLLLAEAHTAARGEPSTLGTASTASRNWENSTFTLLQLWLGGTSVGNPSDSGAKYSQVATDCSKNPRNWKLMRVRHLRAQMASEEQGLRAFRNVTLRSRCASLHNQAPGWAPCRGAGIQTTAKEFS